MNALLLFVFAVVSCWLVVWGLLRPGRVYQYPFLAGAVWVGWLLPQAVGLVNDDTLPEDGYAITMLMAILCAVAMFAGYNSRPKPLRSFAWRFAPERLLVGALFLSVFGSIFNYLIQGLPEELLRPVSGGWSGLPVMYHFFATAQVYGFTIAALHYAKSRSPLALAICIFDLAWFAGSIVLSGRRTFTVQILITILLAAWFGRRWIVPRWIAGTGVVLATLGITSMGYWRGLTGAAYGGVGGRLPSWEEFTTIDFVGNFLKIIEAGAYREELYTAVFDIAAVQLTAAFNLGTSYWNALVFLYVPAQLFGAEIKESLIIDLSNNAARVFGFQAAFGNTHTGLSDSFAAFWLFGALVFFVIARIMRKFYETGLQNHTVAQLTYMLLMGNALEVVTHATAYFFTAFIHIALLTLPVLAWARLPNTRTHEGLR